MAITIKCAPGRFPAGSLNFYLLSLRYLLCVVHVKPRIYEANFDPLRRLGSTYNVCQFLCHQTRLPGSEAYKAKERHLPLKVISAISTDIAFVFKEKDIPFLSPSVKKPLVFFLAGYNRQNASLLQVYRTRAGGR